jgi:aspartate racemase
LNDRENLATHTTRGPIPGTKGMSEPIGIVACSAPGAALCYETICSEACEFLGPHEHPQIALHGYSFGHYARLLEAGNWREIGTLLAGSARKLAGAGAAFVICPDNTVHQALEYVLPESPIPWLHIAEVVAREAQSTGVRRLALLGTRYLMEGPVYPEKLAPAGIEWRIPSAAERATIDRIIFDELVYHRVAEEARRELAYIIDRLAREESCEAVVLGCTELPLAVTAEVSSLPTLDSTRLLARAAIARSLGQNWT